MDAVVSGDQHLLLIEVKGAECRTKSALLDNFAERLKFPEYFGHNWDALTDCLRDLAWLPADGYLIVIHEADKFLSASPNDYETFLDIVTEVGTFWASSTPPGRAKPFHVIFLVDSDRANAREWKVPQLLAATASSLPFCRLTHAVVNATALTMDDTLPVAQALAVKGRPDRRGRRRD